MIQVSNAFKKAIKKPERQIKGYVEVLYNLPNIETTITTNINSTYTSTNEIQNGTRVENIYGSLDYLPLNGVYLTMDNNVNTNAGFISDDLFENLTNPYITLNFSQTTLNGITMYFRENIPKEFTITYSDNTTTTITNNNKEAIQIIFDNSKTLTSVSIAINDMEYSDRKIYLMEIDLGVTQVYKDKDLIEFTIDEEVNKLVEEVPINETNITLNNMSDLFNPLNPSGIVPYLSENTLIKPYIGVLTENLGVEYVKMGEFYFDSYSNNSDLTTTLIGKSIFNRLASEILKDDNEFDVFRSGINKERFINCLNNYNYNFNIVDWNRNVAFFRYNNDSLIQILKDVAFWEDMLFYENRSNNIIMKNMDSDIKDIITKNELIEDVKYKKIDKINVIEITNKSMNANKEVDSREILKTTVKLSKNSEIFLLKGSEPNFIDSISISQSGGSSASIISQGYYMVFVKVSGTIGAEVTITITGTRQRSLAENKIYLKDNSAKNEVKLVFDSPVSVYTNPYLSNSNILQRTPSYEMNFEYNGDPSLEAGDYISVQTPYGYKNLFIQKNHFKFDGGLEGRIEGVE